MLSQLFARLRTRQRRQIQIDRLRRQDVTPPKVVEPRPARKAGEGR